MSSCRKHTFSIFSLTSNEAGCYLDLWFSRKIYLRFSGSEDPRFPYMSVYEMYDFE